jgi:hypothetical protein
MVDGELKIIVLKDVEKTRGSGNQKISRIKRLLKQIQEKNIFQTIDNPVEWQRAIRGQ